MFRFVSSVLLLLSVSAEVPLDGPHRVEIEAERYLSVFYKAFNMTWTNELVDLCRMSLEMPELVDLSNPDLLRVDVVDVIEQVHDHIWSWRHVYYYEGVVSLYGIVIICEPFPG
eukprot:sb/3476895/